ncbi:MAG TPA: hypothetical protein VKU02_16235 [Gemmataceae bacterium]|nr:hypothetical protein [Gemmataceae bacterium]
MRMIKLALLTTLLCNAPGMIRADGTSTGPQTPEGRWYVAHRSFTPSNTTAAIGKVLTDLGHDVEIKNGKISACDPSKAGIYLLAEFRPNTTPKSVDLKVPSNKDKPLKGIYRLDGDVLSLAVSAKNKRPDTFNNAQDQVLLVLKRKPKTSSTPTGPAAK